MAESVPQSALRRALDAVSEGVIIAGADQRILYANAAFTVITGYRREDLTGRDFSMFQGPETDPRTVAALSSAVARDEAFHGEILNYRKDGTPFWNALTITPLLDDTGSVPLFLSLHHDATARNSVPNGI